MADRKQARGGANDPAQVRETAGLVTKEVGGPLLSSRETAREHVMAARVRVAAELAAVKVRMQGVEGQQNIGHFAAKHACLVVDELMRESERRGDLPSSWEPPSR